MPLRVNMAVIPIIFAAAVLAFPPTIAQFFPQTQDFINDWFSPTDVGFLMFEAFLIIIFTYSTRPSSSTPSTKPTTSASTAGTSRASARARRRRSTSTGC